MGITHSACKQENHAYIHILPKIKLSLLFSDLVVECAKELTELGLFEGWVPVELQGPSDDGTAEFLNQPIRFHLELLCASYCRRRSCVLDDCL